MKSSRIVYMGTPDFAVAPLQALIQAGHDIVAVVTVPDKPAGRGRQVQMSAVKKFAIEHGLNVLQPEKLKSESFVEELKGLVPDLMVVVAFRMLPEVVWRIPKLGTFNLHGSLLPQYRGAAPIQWAVMNGDQETGVTTFMIDDRIDTGEILLQSKIKIGPNQSGGEIHDILMHTGADLVVETVKGLAERTIIPQPQRESEDLRPAPKLYKEHMKIDVDASIESVHNQIRGLYPYPCSFVEVEIENQLLNLKLAPGTFVYSSSSTSAMVITDNSIYFKFKNGEYHPTQVQWPGKRMLPIKEILNGLRLRGEFKLR